MDTEKQQIVMLVDDSQVICKQVEMTLKEMSIFLCQAHSGEEALEKIVQYQPDLILLDVVLPDANGYELFHRLKAKDCNNASIVFLTSKDTENDVEKGFEVGACDYIKKPFTKGELKGRIKTHLKQKSERDALHREKTELVTDMKKLNYFAFRDELTGLYNRRYVVGDLVDDIREKKSEEKVNVVVLADIDDFKKVNDVYGHDAGDMALKCIAGIMESNCVKHKVIRWGGEEFLIVLFNVTEREAFEQCEKIRRDVEKFPIMKKDNTFYCTLTLGLHVNNPEEGIEECIACADKALYYGKRHGKNRCVWYEKMETSQESEKQEGML